MAGAVNASPVPLTASASGTVCSPVFLHLRSRLRQAFRPLLLRSHLFCRALSNDRQDHVCGCDRLAGILLLRDALPDLSHMVQLDRLQPDHEFPGHVRVPKRDGHRARHYHPVLASVQHQPIADESEQEDRLKCSLRVGHLLRREQHCAVGVYRRVSVFGPVP